MWRTATSHVICKTRARTGEESKFCGGGRSGYLSIALAPTDQLSIRIVIRQDILVSQLASTFLEMVSSPLSGLDFRSPRNGRVVPSRRREPQLKFLDK